MAGLWTITPTEAQLTNLQTSLQHPDLNASAANPRDGFAIFHALILNQLDRLQIPTKLRTPVKAQISDYLSVWQGSRVELSSRPADADDPPSRDDPVDAWAQIWAYRADGKLQWTLKVTWDSNGPGADARTLPHYGYQVFFNGTRTAIGRVFFTRSAPLACRDGGRMHEMNRGQYKSQWMHSVEKQQIRCDCALRLWGRGSDRELAPDAASDAEYNELLHAPPSSWETYALPSFGRNG